MLSVISQPGVTPNCVIVTVPLTGIWPYLPMKPRSPLLSTYEKETHYVQLHFPNDLTKRTWLHLGKDNGFKPWSPG